MDKLEQVKTENATNDAIQDDVAAQAYVEQFGLETFNRADSVVRANKVSPLVFGRLLCARLVLNHWQADRGHLQGGSYLPRPSPNIWTTRFRSSGEIEVCQVPCASNRQGSQSW